MQIVISNAWLLSAANDQRPTTNDRLHPMPNSSDASSGVPQRRQMMAEQSPQVSGSVTSTAQTGQ
ncbi:MAG: hypothetical protein WBQ43_15310 [Terriglobales bacterium]